jgi:hypothetical protein
MNKFEFESFGVKFEATPAGLLVTLPAENVGTNSEVVRSFLSALPGSTVAEAADDGRYLIAPQALHALARADFPLIGWLFPPSPYRIEVAATGTPGFPDFQFYIRYILGETPAAVYDCGALLCGGSTTYLLGEGQYALVACVRAFNARPAAERTKAIAFLAIEEVKRLAAAHDAQTDEFLTQQEVIAPNEVGLGIYTEAGDAITMYPTVEGVDDALLRKEFIRLSDVQAVYDLPRAGGGRVRVVVPPHTADALRDMQRVRRVKGAERDRVLANPMSAMRDGTERSGLSPRVKGLTSAPLLARVGVQTKKSAWFGTDQAENCDPGLIVQTAEGSEFISFETRATFEEFSRAVSEAHANGEGSVPFQGRRIVVNNDVIRGVAEVEKRYQGGTRPAGDGTPPSTGNNVYLDIYLNEESLEFAEGADAALGAVPLVAQIPQTLKETVTLKAHQKGGLAWLQHLYRNRHARAGCLLADDMGLGKTLQVLAFLASLIEELDPQNLGQRTGPYAPVLIVAPSILHKSWEAEMDNRFREGIFKNRLILHGAELTRLRREDAEDGRELALARPVLDLDRLARYRLIITNYDTVRNYQHSLARMRWSVVVVDEAQAIKDRNATSYALKALNAVSAFKILSTGTPVENTLMDLWNLFDFAQPGSLLGTAADFRRRYAKDIDDKSDAERQAIGAELRERLRYDRPDAFVLRREKAGHLPDLPRKESHYVRIDISEQERELYGDLIMQAKARPAHALSLLRAMRRLSDHPALYRGYQGVSDVRAFIGESPKLQRVLDIMRDIRHRREKVLVFTESLNMQQILREAFAAEFGIDAGIINGERVGDSAKQAKARDELLKAFEGKDGFNILILSPRVAGVGLTIVGANHVIHYSRWWNPAREAQATDRVYRIGQERDVHVYYPILTDSSGAISTFDETLNERLSAKAQLASDFLVPSAKLELSEDEMLAAVCAAAPNGPSVDPAAALLKSRDDIATLTPSDFEVVVALLLAREGYHTIVNGRPGDSGVDVFGWKDNTLALVQVKHSSGATLFRSNAVEELSRGLAYYINRLPQRLRAQPARMLAISNAEFDRDAIRQAKSSGDPIQLRGGREVVRAIIEAKISYGAIQTKGLDRVRNDAELRERLNALGTE